MPIFRKLEPSDMDQVSRVWASLESHYDHPVGGEWNLKKLYQELQTKESLGVFDDKGELQAFVFYIESPGIKEITLLVTESRYHRSGAMRALIRSILFDLEPEEKVWLEVHAGNLPAIGLYESLGFRLCGERLNYYSDGAKALLYEYPPEN